LNASRKTPSIDAVIVISLLFLALWVRLSTLMMIHTGVDESDYWMAAKALSQGVAFPALNHRTVRWGVILPVAIIQRVFGTHPLVCYVAPLLNDLLQVFLIFRLGTLIRRRVTGTLAALALVFFPYQIRAGSQIGPEIFSITYILLTVIPLVRALRSSGGKRLAYLAASSLAMFFAYETKITSLYFLPGVFLALLLYAGKTRIRDCFAFGIPLLALYLAETGIYAVLTGYPLGQLSVIAANHFESVNEAPLRSLFDVFLRYSPKNLGLDWLVPFVAFALAGSYYLAKSRVKELRGVIVIALSFFFFITFTVKSLRPITMVELFINRYFYAVLPLVFVTVAYAAESALRRYIPASLRIFETKNGALFAGTAFSLCVAISAVFALPMLPSGVRQYANNPLKPAEHPLALTARYYRELNAAWDSGVPILSAVSKAGDDAERTVSRFFLAPETYTQGKPPERIAREINGVSAYVLSRTGDAEGDRFIQVVRAPFRVAFAPMNRVSRIDAEKIVK